MPTAENRLMTMKKIYMFVLSPRFITKLTGGLAGALGLLVIAGWHTHNLTLIQVLPGLAAMQFNTALGFVLSGMALVGAIGSRVRLPFACGAIVALVGLLTQIEDIFSGCGYGHR
jgi:hypothetical protein